MPLRRFSRQSGGGAFLASRRGGVGLIVAIALPVLIGFAALAAEYGHALLIKSDDQRVADLAAYAAGLAYNANGTSAAMTGAAQAAAALNGVAAANVAAALATSPSGDGNPAVQVTVTTPLQLYLAEILGASAKLPVSSTAYAELKAAGAPCVIGLSTSGTGVTLSGGTSLGAPSCTVASNATVSVPCGTSITTKVVDYDSAAAPSQPCSGIQPPSGTGATTLSKRLTSDPLAGTAGVTAATGRIGVVAAQTAPAAPTVSGGTALVFDFNNSAGPVLTAAGCASSGGSSGNYTVTCPGGGSYRFGALTVSGGVTVSFNVSGSATYAFSGPVSVGGGAHLSFGPGNFTLAQGLSIQGGSTGTFGAGTFAIGPLSSGCNGAVYSICNTGTSLVFGGPSAFVVSSGVYNAGGSTLAMGSGSGNSYQIGPGGSGSALALQGGSTTTLAANGTASLFQLKGGLTVSGGACVVLPAAAQHDINGSVATAGGLVLGAGLYTVNGYVAFGAFGGGDVSCNGSTVGVSGAGITLVVSGTSTPSSGSCSGEAFCVAAGFNNVTLTAPASGTTEGLVVVGPASTGISAGAAFTEGAADTDLSGAFYFPNGPITLSGGASVGGGSGQCLQLIGSQIALTGGSAAASTCVGGGNGSNASVALVQ